MIGPNTTKACMTFAVWN